ncbi:hypothetical protein OAO18_00375 [Francisellaceae bacterium]|nr:hypothetical protein [Francisellaceae bacterium]
MKSKIFSILILLTSFTLSYASCLIPAYKVLYDFDGGAEGTIKSELTGDNGKYNFYSEITAHKFFFTGTVERSSKGIIDENGFKDLSYKINEGFNNVSYDVAIDYAKHQITSKQENKIYTLGFAKDTPVMGKIIYPQQLRLMLLKDPDLKQAHFNIAYHKKNAKMEIVDLNFSRIKTEKLNTTIGDLDTEVYEADYEFEDQAFRVIFWYAPDKGQLLAKSEIWVDGKLSLRSIVKEYQPLDQCVVEEG